MAEPTKVATTVAFTFNETAVKEKLSAIEDAVNAVAGQRNQNPFIWLHDKVNPLVERYSKGERSKELQDAILALSDAPPSPYKVTSKAEAVPEKNVKLTPSGLVFPVKPGKVEGIDKPSA